MQAKAMQGMAAQGMAAQGMAAATYPPFVIGTFSQTLTARPACAAPSGYQRAPDPRVCVSTNGNASGVITRDRQR